jgi:hypothetical protein
MALYKKFKLSLTIFSLFFLTACANHLNNAIDSAIMSNHNSKMEKHQAVVEKLKYEAKAINDLMHISKNKDVLVIFGLVSTSDLEDTNTILNSINNERYDLVYTEQLHIKRLITKTNKATSIFKKEYKKIVLIKEKLTVLADSVEVDYKVDIFTPSNYNSKQKTYTGKHNDLIVDTRIKVLNELKASLSSLDNKDKQTLSYYSNSNEKIQKMIYNIWFDYKRSFSLKYYFEPEFVEVVSQSLNGGYWEIAYSFIKDKWVRELTKEEKMTALAMFSSIIMPPKRISAYHLEVMSFIALEGNPFSTVFDDYWTQLLKDSNTAGNKHFNERLINKFIANEKEKGRSLFQLAIKQYLYTENHALIDSIIENKISLNELNSSGNSALTAEILSNNGSRVNLARLQTLILNGVDLELFGVIDSSVTSLMAAASSGDFELVNLLIKSGVNPKTKDSRGRNALFYAFNPERFEFTSDDKEIITLLVESGLNPNSLSKEGLTPMENYKVEHEAFISSLKSD